MNRRTYRPRNLDAVTQFVTAKYVAHPGEVAHVTRVADATLNPIDWTVAMLHDLVEDGFATMDEIERLVGDTKLGDGAVMIVPALELLTRRGEPYDAYIERIATAGNRTAITVKLLDLFDHLSPYTRASLPEKNIDRYVAAIHRLASVRMES
jgi:(p)ppGpp synthase/HD superfamily hydrolase